METVLLNLANMSINAGWFVLAILVLRPLLRKGPRWICCLLWGLVAVRLICPVSVQSIFSLIPSAQPLPVDFVNGDLPQINSGINVIDSIVNPVLSGSLEPAPGASINPSQIQFLFLTWIWIAGASAILLYGSVSYLRLKKRLKTSTALRENIRQSEYADTPFVMGFFRPVIYLPYNIPSKDMAYMIAHENAHIRRKDHWWKAAGYVLLAIYWFNPLIWLAYILLCRDIEAACDEKTIKAMNECERREYASTLLKYSVSRRMIITCPPAFGEIRVKERIKRIMDHKKPSVWLIVLAMVCCTAAVVCFLTDPPENSSADTGLSSSAVIGENGHIVLKDGMCTRGSDQWESFLHKVSDGQQADVYLDHYYTADGISSGKTPAQTAGPDGSDSLFLFHLVYDGKTFSLTEEDQDRTAYTREYRYLRRFEVPYTANQPPQNTSSLLQYVLINDPDMTWDEIIQSITSSQYQDHIDFMVIYAQPLS